MEKDQERLKRRPGSVGSAADHPGTGRTRSNAFIPREYWTLDAEFQIHGEKKPLTAHFYGKEKEKISLDSEKQLDEILKELEGCSFSVAELKKGERRRKAPQPFTTSTMQQEAAKVLNFSTQKTMRLAQQLYEGH